LNSVPTVPVVPVNKKNLWKRTGADLSNELIEEKKGISPLLSKIVF
jgi:hypothetical protein